MAAVSEDKFISKLKEIGYKVPSNVSYKWMIEHENTKELLEWFCDNISSSNYLSEEELKEYEEIEASGNALKGDELDKEVEKLIPNYEDLDGKETELLNELRKELSEEQDLSKTLETLESKISEELASINSKEKDIEEKNNSLKKKIVKAQEECLGRYSALESAWSGLSKNIKNVAKYCDQFNEGVQNPQFIAEFPFESYIEENALFECRLQQYIDEFKLSTNSQQDTHLYSKKEWDLELEKLRKGYEASRLLRIKAESERKGLESACSHVKDVLKSKELLTFVLNPGLVREKVLETKRKIQNMKQELGELRIHGAGADVTGPKHVSGWEGWWKKTEEAVRACAMHQCYELECLYSEGVLMEKNASLKRLKSILGILKTQCAADIVWMLLLGEEVTRILNISELISSGAEYLISEQNDRLQRMELMRKYKERRDYDIQRMESWPLFNSLFYYLTQHLQRDEESRSFISSFSSLRISPSNDLSSALQTLAKSSENWNAEMTTLEGSLLEQIHQLFSMISARLKEIFQLRKKVFSGSTSTKAVVCPVEQILFANQHQELLEKFGHKMKSLKKSYTTDKTRATASVKILRTFWITFLTNPKVLQEMLATSKF